MSILNTLGLVGLASAALLFQDPGNARPAANQQGQAAKAGQAEQMDLFEDRSVVLVGRIVHKDDEWLLRVKSIGNFAPGKAAGDHPGGNGMLVNQQGGNAGAQGNAGAKEGPKQRGGKAHSLKVDEDVTLLKSSMLEDIEEDVGLKHVEAKGKESDMSEMIQVQGILTMYKDQPFILIQSYRTRTESDTTKPGGGG